MSSDFELELKSTFLDEASQLLVDAEQCFLSLETSPNDLTLIEKIFRLAHNLKGSANAVGFTSLGEFTHELESYLLKLKSKEIQISDKAVDLLLRCNDQLCLMVEELKLNTSASFDNSELLGEIKAMIAGEHFDSSVQDDQESTQVQDLPEDTQESEEKSKPVELHIFNDGPKVLPRPTEEANTGAIPQKTAGTSAASIDESIRVSLQRVERLINFVGEIVILQTVISEQAKNSNSLMLRKTVHQMRKVTKEIQDISMGLRMVPVKSTFQKMQRIVRDTSSVLGKSIQLHLVGEDTELDKTVLEKISDPLVHLIRNAVDHGIESKETRLERGKPETGNIHLRAFHQGDKLMIEVSDDGAGLDPQKLRAKAVEKGILKPNSTLSDKESYQLIFHSGFSTKTNVTDVSGRGVGMDVVKTNIEQLQGEIQIDTALGKGTTMKIQLPLTLAIIEGMIILSSGERYVIPLSHVHESAKLEADDIHTVTGQGEVYKLRGENIPLHNLTTLLGHRIQQNTKYEDKIAIVVRTTDKVFAVVVDDIIGQSQVVIKKLGMEYRDLRGFTGSAILGDCRAALILELPELVSRYRQESSHLTLKRKAS